MVLKLYGFLASSNLQRVRIILEETETPYEVVLVDVSGGQHRTPEFMARHPFGQVPYIEDDGLILFESRAISRYIAAKADSSLLPKGDARKTAFFEQAVSIELSNFDPFATGIRMQRIVMPTRLGRPCDEALVHQYASTLEGKFAGYEKILAKQRYLAGDELTLADLFHLPAGAGLAAQGFHFLQDTEKFPNVARWWKDISSRPSWKKVLEASSS